MKLKKFLCLLLIAASLLAMAGCGSRVPNYVYSLEDLAGKKIGAVEGTVAYIRASKNSYEGATVRGYANMSMAVAGLKAGEVDCLFVDEEEADKAARSAGVKILDVELPDEHFGFAVAKENADLTAVMNSAIAALNEDGIIKKIVNGYMNGSNYRYEPMEIEGTAEIVMECDFAGAPFCFIDSNGEMAGIEIDVAQAICDVLGVELRIERADYDSLIVDAQKGRASFSAGRLSTEDVGGDLVDFTDAYFVASQKILVRK